VICGGDGDLSRAGESVESSLPYLRSLKLKAVVFWLATRLVRAEDMLIHARCSLMASALCLCYMLLSEGVYIMPQLTCVVRIYEVELR